MEEEVVVAELIGIQPNSGKFQKHQLPPNVNPIVYAVDFKKSQDMIS
jgi:hypothetical protein